MAIGLQHTRAFKFFSPSFARTSFHAGDDSILTTLPLPTAEPFLSGLFLGTGRLPPSLSQRLVVRPDDRLVGVSPCMTCVP